MKSGQESEQRFVGDYRQVRYAPACPKCGSTRREPYHGTLVRKLSTHVKGPDGAAYDTQIRRRTRCLDCGTQRMDFEYR